MLNLTKEIKLDAKYEALYKKLRLGLYLLAIFLFAYFIYLTLFPRQTFFFTFLKPTSTKNSLEKPEINRATFPKDDTLRPAEKLYFDAAPEGNFSNVKLSLNLKEKTASQNTLVVIARKSYESFLKNEGLPVGFKEGSLLKNKNEYYIISAGTARRFSNLSLVQKMGYPHENFQNIEEGDLQYNLPGEIIQSNEDYPESTLFQIENVYYILRQGELWQFTSENAFLSQYSPSWVLKKEISFFEKYPASENMLGFAEGSLVSNGDSAYFIGYQGIYPINSTETFESKGFLWKDVFPAGSDEINFYEKMKLFDLRTPHPDGIIFKTDDSKYYILREGLKCFLPSENIALSWLGKRSPIDVSRRSEEISERCELVKKNILSNSYFCKIELKNIQPLLGPDYDFELSTREEIALKEIRIRFDKAVNNDNFKSSLSSILSNIKLNYVQQNTR